LVVCVGDNYAVNSSKIVQASFVNFCVKISGEGINDKLHAGVDITATSPGRFKTFLSEPCIHGSDKKVLKRPGSPSFSVCTKSTDIGNIQEGNVLFLLIWNQN